MAKHKEEKTNVMRVLDQKKIPYTAHPYDPESGIDGVSVARSLGQDPASVFKTPVGMKKLFPTVFHETAASLPVIMVSAGKLGHQIACDPKALLALVRADTADIITEE